MTSFRLPVAGCLLFVAVGVFAQDQYTPTPPIPIGNQLLNLPSSHVASKGTWEVKFTHRFNQSLDQGSFSDRIHSLYGLDSNADVGLGLSYVAVRDLDLSIYRSNVEDDIEFAGRYNLFQQAAAIPFSTAIRLGADWRTERDVHDRTSGFAQAIFSHQFGQRAEISIVPTYVTDAGRAVSDNASGALFKHAFNVPIGVVLQLRPGFSLVGEFTPMNRDLPDTMHGDPAWAIGMKSVVGKHYFELLISNSNATHADQYPTSTYQGSPLVKGDLHLGFNIERRFGR